MSDLSRRALVAALPALAVPAATIAAASPGSSNLAILAGIERELARVAAAIDATYPDNVAAFRRWGAIRDPWLVPMPPSRWASARDRYRYARQKERWDRRLDLAREEAGLAATEGRLSDLRDERNGLTARIGHVRATDLASLQAKARIAQTYSTSALGSFAADVLAMASL